MYREKRFRAKPRSQIQQEIEEARKELGLRSQTSVRRVFLADGDAMCLSFARLAECLDHLNEAFPDLQRVGIYANAWDVLKKTDHELQELRQRKLKILYIGLESGDPETLTGIKKGATVEQIIEAVQRAQAAGMMTSVMVLIGLGGRQRSLIHAETSAEAINRMRPTYTALLTYTPVPGSPLFDELQHGRFELPSPLDSIREIRAFISALDCRTYFTCNHASNYLSLKGKLPSARERLLAMLDAALCGELALKPEHLRGL
jgi:radical SAM superfamily enzyme YgiQ (UPF0313 family)